MDKEKIHYCFTLSEEQLEYLRSKKYKIDRMECFMSLVVLAERETKLVSQSKTKQVEILPVQMMVDNTQLAKLWDKDRKTVPKLLEVMDLWIFLLRRRLEKTASIHFIPFRAGMWMAGSSRIRLHQEGTPMALQLFVRMFPLQGSSQQR